MFTKLAVDPSTFGTAAVPLRIPNLPPWLLRKPLVALELLQFVHQTTFAFVATAFSSHLRILYDHLLKSIQTDQKPLLEPAAAFT